jgi:exonuclease III
MINSPISIGQQGVASINTSQQQKKFIQSSLSTNMHLIHHYSSSYSSTHQLSFASLKNKNVLAHKNLLSFLSFNAFNAGQQMLGDLLQLMCELKIHIIALQDTGKLFQTKEGKLTYGNYHIEHYQFGEGKNDSLAFIIDEGITHHIIKELKFTTNACARTMVLTIPKILQGKDLHLINTYAPPSQKQKHIYIQHLINFMQQHNFTSNNSIIMGDLNDFINRLIIKKQHFKDK